MDNKIIESVTEAGIDFNNLNYPFKKDHKRIKIKRRGLNIDPSGVYYAICKECNTEFALTSSKSIATKCPQCSLIKGQCRKCGAEFLSTSALSKYCKDHQKNSPNDERSLRKLIKNFIVQYKFNSRPEALKFIMRFYIKHQEEAEKEREIYREYLKNKMEIQKQEKELLKRQKMNPGIDLSKISIIS
jgi:hypothetical protein